MSPSPAFVRTAGRRDIAAIRALLVETWHATYDRLYGVDKVVAITDAWHAPEALEKRLAVPQSEFLVADDGQSILGMAFARRSGDTILLKQLYVSPVAQRRGIGSMLLFEAIDCFDGARAVRLEVDPGNEAAIAFYRMRGFLEAGRTDDCGSDGSGIAALIMERRL